MDLGEWGRAERMSAEPVSTAALSADLPASTMRRDVTWAYVAAGARIGSTALVGGFLYRFAGAAPFAMFAMVRGTIGILNYTSLGLAPAMVRLLAEARHGDPKLVLPERMAAQTLEGQSPQALEHAEPIIFSNGVVVAAMSLAIGLVLTAGCAHWSDRLLRIPPGVGQMPMVVFWIGLGMLLRLFSDSCGAVLQTRGRIARDNQLLALSEAAWVVLFVAIGARAIHVKSAALLLDAALSYALAGGVLAIARALAVVQLQHTPWPPRKALVESKMLRRLMAFGFLVLLAQLADYLYAPTDFILINRFLDTVANAAYAPAVQIDAGLLMLVTAVASVLLPKAALAHTAGAMHVVRRYYIRGTLATAGILLASALVMLAIAPWLLRVWFGRNPPATVAILPLVLIHTVAGGSSAVGRSILLAMGKVKPFTASVLIAGAVNVIASLLLVRYTGLGLRGIVLGTIIAVVGRCMFWMPWYVLRTLKREARGLKAKSPTPAGISLAS